MVAVDHVMFKKNLTMVSVERLFWVAHRQGPGHGGLAVTSYFCITISVPLRAPCSFLLLPKNVRGKKRIALNNL
jgi:hypothetical protein